MRRPLLSLTFAGCLALSACRTATVSGPQGTTPAGQQPGAAATVPAGADALPAGTQLHVRLNDEISTEHSKVGDTVRAALATPVVDAAGNTVVPAGAPVEGKVTALDPSPHAGEPASVNVDFNRIEVQGQAKPMSTDITEAHPETSRDYKRAGKGAAIGGLGGLATGAILGRSVKGAVIGGVLGAGAGTAISLGTGEADAKLPAGTEMTLALREPVPIK